MGRVVEFLADDGTRLTGTLLVPSAPVLPAGILLLSGSGPLDRDSNLPQQRLDVAAALGASLASHGIASLRFDKRGVGESGGQYLTTGFHRETADAAAALSALRNSPSIDPTRVAIIGHSVGATIAIRLAAAAAHSANAHSEGGGGAADPPPVAVPALLGVVLLAGAARPGAEVMAWQSRRIAATLPRALRPFGPLSCGRRHVVGVGSAGRRRTSSGSTGAASRHDGCAST